MKNEELCELLELAAKAAGAEVNGWRGAEPHYALPVEDDEGTTYIPWAPHLDDGDALRLAVTLGISIAPGSKTNRFVVTHSTEQILEERRPDEYAATRIAIVRAAAEIGRQMP